MSLAEVRGFLEALAKVTPDPRSELSFIDPYTLLIAVVLSAQATDVSVNRATDTVIARATMANPDGILTDGQLVNVTGEAGQPEERVTIPQAALIADQAGVYVFAVEDGKAVIKRVKPGSERGTNVVVEGRNSHRVLLAQKQI